MGGYDSQDSGPGGGGGGSARGGDEAPTTPDLSSDTAEDSGSLQDPGSVPLSDMTSPPSYRSPTQPPLKK